jgi:membrane protease YdiL (CAAX protease family)
VLLLVQSVVVGMVIAMAGTIPRNLFYLANLRIAPAVPWAIPVAAAYLWFFWRYLRGDGPPAGTAAERRQHLRANPLPLRVWTWALVAGGVGVVALVVALRVLNRFVALPAQTLPDFGAVPRQTIVALLLAAAPIAGVIEEAAFRGYMQRPLERRFGLVVAILVTGTMFAVAHLDFTPVLWPYYVAVAALYGGIASITDSILPAIVLHTAGNLYSNLSLLFYGRAEWQTAADGTTAGPPIPLMLALGVATAAAFVMLRRSARRA